MNTRPDPVNTTQIGTQTLGFDDRNRLSTRGTTTFDYSGRGERVYKNVPKASVGPGRPTGAMTYAYLENGVLASEYAAYWQCVSHTTNAGNSVAQNKNAGEAPAAPICPTGSVLQSFWQPSADYIYLDNLPIAVVKAGQLYYIETDHLGTPREVIQPGATTASDTVVWKWDFFGSAFGENAPNPQTITFNLRYPGQYFDQETGLNYNGFRDYEPGTGRYVESDPIGIYGGMNTYSYVSASPLAWLDIYGLLKWNILPTEWSSTFLPGSHTRTDPGAKAENYDPGTMARTTIDWSVAEPCSCINGNFNLDEYAVDLKTVVFLRSRYIDMAQSTVVRRDELDHVADFHRWMDSARAGAQALEDSQKTMTFTNQADCQASAERNMQSYLHNGAADAETDSKIKWDSGRHKHAKPGT